MKDDLISKTDIEIYNLVRNGSLRSFPHGFWDGVNGYLTAKKILKYVFEDILKWTPDDIRGRATKAIFDEYKLGRIVSSVFDGSIYKAIGETYPDLKEWSERMYQRNEYAEDEYRRYTDEEMITILKDKANELNRIPKKEDMQNPIGNTYTNRFGSWEKALMMAGLIENIYGNVDLKRYSKEVIVEHLKEECIKRERLLEKEEIYQLYPEGVIRGFFEAHRTLKRILENDYTKEELIFSLKRKAKQLERIPTNKDMKFPRVAIFIDKFGSWQNAIDEILK